MTHAIIRKAPRSRGEYMADAGGTFWTITQGPLRGKLWQAVTRPGQPARATIFAATLSDLDETLAAGRFND